jgi:PAS domain S-box-containing protein
VLDAQDRTSFVNPKLIEMSGFTAEEILGRSPLDFVDERWHSTLRKVKTGRVTNGSRSGEK